MASTPLMKAVKANNVDEVVRLIASNVDVNQKDSNGDAPLVMSAYLGHTEITQRLLEAGADVTVTDPGMKATALHAAAYAGRARDAALLIQYGVEVDKQGPYNGYTALHDAIWQDNVETTRVILAANPDFSLKNHEGQTPLEMARARGRREITARIAAAP